jgi:hypothetical protein
LKIFSIPVFYELNDDWFLVPMRARLDRDYAIPTSPQYEFLFLNVFITQVRERDADKCV